MMNISRGESKMYLAIHENASIDIAVIPPEHLQWVRNMTVDFHFGDPDPTFAIEEIVSLNKTPGPYSSAQKIAKYLDDYKIKFIVTYGFDLTYLRDYLDSINGLDKNEVHSNEVHNVEVHSNEVVLIDVNSIIQFMLCQGLLEGLTSDTFHYLGVEEHENKAVMTAQLFLNLLFYSKLQEIL